MMETYLYRHRLHVMRQLMYAARTIPFIPTDDQFQKALDNTPKLKDRDKFIVGQYFNGHTPAFISNHLEKPISRARVTQIIQKTFRRMRGKGNLGLLNIGFTQEQLEQYNRERFDYFGR